ncbi:hypothetical protein L6452_18280 [Arctium lappa]|uniref:Uncharacterized protein n=1 Tax=Arctium lappa TaxID=4217 RepID=A0ACB9C5Q2_ARCLA|nr:hypothetical protein L6452_18280 [Arctium lappa]
MRFKILTQISVFFSLGSRKAQFAFHLGHANLICVSSVSRKANLAYLAHHAKLVHAKSCTENRPPVLIDENEFTQWQDRFLNFIERQKNGNDTMIILSEGPFEKPKLASGLYKPTKEYSHDELSAYQADRDIKANLMLALPNSIYNRIDCFKTHPNMMWQ